MSQHLPLVAAQPGIWMAENCRIYPPPERGALR